MKEDISLGELLLEVLRFLRRNILILGIAVVLGTVIGYVLEKNRAAQYDSELVLCSDLVEHSRLKEILDDLSRSVNEQNFEYISQFSDLEATALTGLKRLDVKVIARAKGLKINEELMDNPVNNCVRLSCTTEDPNLLPELQSICLKALAENSLVKKLYNNKKTVLSESSERLEEDIQLLRENRKKFLAGEDEEAASEDTQGDLNEAYTLKINYDERLGRLTQAYVVKPFNALVSASQEATKQAMMYALLFLVLAIAFAFFRELKL